MRTLIPADSELILEIEVFATLKLVEVKPFEVRLTSNSSADGIKTLEWSCKSLEESNFEKVCKLYNEGMTQGEIAEELEINKSTVSRYVSRGKNECKINQQND